MNRYHCQGQEMRKSQDVEINLVDGINQLFEPVRDKLAQPRHIPAQRNEECKNKISDSNRQRRGRLPHICEALRSSQRTPGTEHKQQLPGKRIKEPVPRGIARQVPIEMPS